MTGKKGNGADVKQKMTDRQETLGMSWKFCICHVKMNIKSNYHGMKQLGTLQSVTWQKYQWTVCLHIVAVSLSFENKSRYTLTTFNNTYIFKCLLNSQEQIDRVVLQFLSLSLWVLPQLPSWIPGHTRMSALTRQEGKSMWHFCPTFLGLDQATLLCLFVCLGETYTYESLLFGCMTVTFFTPVDSDLNFLRMQGNIPALFQSLNYSPTVCECVSWLPIQSECEPCVNIQCEKRGSLLKSGHLSK